MRSIKRIVSMVLTVVMLLGMIPTQTVSALSLKDLMGTQNTVEPAMARNDDFSLQLEWKDNNSNTALDINESQDVRNAATLRVNYTCMNVRPEGYKAGDLVITVKGIGNVQRGSTLEALVGADKINSGNKTHDWSYSWNRANDAYTLTNNKDISGGSVLSGYFELTWGLESRNCKTNYTQSDISASMYLPEGQPLTTPALSFSHNTTKDDFTVNVTEQNMYGYQGLTDNIQNPDDYAWVKYEIDTTMTRKARGAYGQRLVIDPDADNIGSGAICLNPNLTIQDNHDGTFSIFGLRDWDSSLNYIDQSFTLYVAYPKDQYATKHVKLNVQRVGHWYDESDENAVLAEKQIDKTIPGDFSFGHVPGSLYRMWLDTHYYDHSMHLGDIYGPGMQNNYSDYFYMNLALNAEGNPHTAEMVVDNFYITTKDDYRALNADEYELTSISIPSAQSITNLNGVPVEADTMSAEIYTAQNGTKIDPQNSEPFKTVPITTSGSNINLPENTTAVAVVLKDVTDNILQASFTVKATFHTKQNTDNLDSGKLVPVAFIRVYNQEAEGTKFGSWVNTATENDYTDTTELHLADRDKNTYGSYLIREKTEITFFGETPDYQKALIQAEALEQVDRHYETTVEVSGRFSYDYTNPPDNYTLYTILPARYSLKGYTVPEDIYDIIETSIPTTSIDVDTNYRDTGLTYIAMHFNQPVDGTVSASIPVKTDRNEDVKIYGVLMNHVPVDANVGSQLDNGKWSENQALYSDLNNDGNSDEKLSYESTMIHKALAADSSELSVKKYVQSQYSDGFTQSAPAEFNGDYTYELSIRTGNGKATNLVVTDILEAAEGSEWHGFLKSVDLSQCEAIGIKGTVKYSTSATPGDSSSSSWTTNPENARAIMVDFSGSVINPGTELNILVHMVAPNEPSLENKKAYNTFHADFDLQDATRPGSEPVHQALDSSQTAASLTKSLETIIITKEDEVDQTRLKDAVFELYDTDDPDLKIATATTNDNGYAIFHYIPSGNEYILQEVQAPAGYLPVEDQTIKVDTNTLRLTIKDPRKPGSIQIAKTVEINSSPLGGAEFAVFSQTTDEQIGESVITDKLGLATIENLPWGEYYLKEINAPKGYIVSDKTYEFSVNRESVEQTTPILRIENEQEPTKLAVLKTDEEKQPLNGAILELVYQIDENNSFRYGLYVTDTNGRVDIEDLPYGSYILKEYRAPEGYEKFQEYHFTIQPETPVEDGFHVIALEAKDTHKKGSVTIIKSDDIGNQIKDIEFTLYDQENHEVGKAVTNEAGVAKIDGLEWGSYILKETDAPDYYEIDEEGRPIEITASNLDIQLTIVNGTQKGKIVMTKYDETETNKLEGAVYSLYSAAGAYLGDYTTGADGTLTVENLAWGSYYFKEKKAPRWYSLSDETIRFSINANNSTTIQELTATDKEMTSSITITKTIDANDINFANGNPTFIFKAETNTASEVFYKSVVFDEDYVKSHTDENGQVSIDVTFAGLPQGIYEVSELDTSRYTTKQITNVVRGEVQDDKVIIDLTDSSATGVVSIPTGAAEFINDNYEAQDYSHTDLRTNILSERQKLTSISVNYEDSIVDAGSAVDHDKLTVIANYDDGTSRTLNSNEYHLSQETFSTVNGEYTIDVDFTDNGITRRGNFTVNINNGVNCIISLEATYINKKPLNVGDSITPDMFTVKAKTNTGDTRTLKANEYLVWMPNENIAAIAADELNDVRIVLNIDNGGYDVSATVTNIPAIKPQPILQKGTDFKKNIKANTTAILFTNASWPSGAELIDVSAAQDNSVVAWYVGTTMYVRTKNSNDPVIANQDSQQMFASKSSLKELDLSNLDTSRITNMYGIFVGCSGLTQLDLSTWNTSNVQNMDSIFLNCSGLTELNLANWDTSSTTNMSAMFYNCSNLTQLDVSHFNTSKVTNMASMFADCTSLQELDVSHFNTAKVTNMYNMFRADKNLTELNLSTWDTSNVKNMSSMFYDCSNITALDLSNFDTSNVTNMSYMFYCSSKQQPNGGSRPDSKLTQLNVSSFNTSNVIDMSYMFGGCQDLQTLDLSNFDTSKVTNMSGMFYFCDSLTQLNISRLNTTNVTNMSYMFVYCTSITELNTSNFDTSNVKNMHRMFYVCTNLTTVDVSNFDTSNVTDMSEMFVFDFDLQNLDVSNWDVSKVKNMNELFYGCQEIPTLDVSKWNTANVTNMKLMFSNCRKITNLNLSNWNTQKVTNMKSMFSGCDTLRQLDLSSFDTSNVTDFDNMFTGCIAVSTAYARTQDDADKFNNSTDKPANVNFVVKPAA